MVTSLIIRVEMLKYLAVNVFKLLVKADISLYLRSCLKIEKKIVITSNHQDNPGKNGDDVLALGAHNSHVIASAAWQSRTVQVRSV